MWKTAEFSSFMCTESNIYPELCEWNNNCEKSMLYFLDVTQQAYNNVVRATLQDRYIKWMNEWNVWCKRKTVRKTSKTILFSLFCMKIHWPFKHTSLCFVHIFNINLPNYVKIINDWYKYEIGENRKAIQNTTMVNDILVCVLHNFYVINTMYDVPIKISIAKQ